MSDEAVHVRGGGRTAGRSRRAPGRQRGRGARPVLHVLLSRDDRAARFAARRGRASRGGAAGPVAGRSILGDAGPADDRCGGGCRWTGPATVKRPAGARAAAWRRFGASKPAPCTRSARWRWLRRPTWVVMVVTARRRPSERPAPAAATATPGRTRTGGEALGDVAELDSSALRRLLDRLGRHAPPALAGGTRVVSDVQDSSDGADIPADDEPRVSDEVADLDGDALRRVASSLHGAAL